LQETVVHMGNTRENILREALKLFIDKGYRKTTIADIEAAAGLVPRAGAFYRHFKSKADLAAEIGEASIIETRRDLGFDGILPLGDTHAELVLMAKGYLQAAKRQAKAAALIFEVRNLEQIRDLEERVDRDLLRVLTGWLAEKRFARGKSRSELVTLGFVVFGGWLFYLSKRGARGLPAGLTDASMLDAWARFWAGILDGE